jgi:HEPN domain-containing protein
LKEGSQSLDTFHPPLLGSLPEGARWPETSYAKELDKHYIPTRYPNGFERGVPVDVYTRGEPGRAIAHAEATLDFGRRQVG